MNFGQQKKKSEGKDDENWCYHFLRLGIAEKQNKGQVFDPFFLKVRWSTKTKQEIEEEYDRQLHMTSFGVRLNYVDVKEIYSFPSSVQSPLILSEVITTAAFL